MKHVLSYLAVSCLLLSAGPLGPETSVAGVEPKLAFHLTDHATKGRCSTATPNGTNTPCSAFVTQGNLMTSYDAYIVLANVPVSGTAGATFGILYDQQSGSGVDVFDWVGCGDLEFPGNAWPEACGGNVITWSTCQSEDIGGEGVQATLGSFYVYAYSNDSMLLTERLYVPNPDLQWSNCAANTMNIQSQSTGEVRFGSGVGCNPCLKGCFGALPPTVSSGGADCSVPTKPVSWGGIKLRNRGN
ncbi:MAG: hypothetical protein HKN21_04520 [Candidatus Eisenbacteria bacterium]|uniref:Uncharacterized protein n=1 Tax=Eiseniibacteriota bacterium TaxID=2212470 RepID=A0A7Y2E7X6_UNCEI|nr:hypothetical protein [Candidatus Eisenbacteria bacterium]